MKKRVLPLLMLLCAGLGFQPAHAAAVSISAGIGGIGINIHAASDFYQPLAPYGTWVNVPNYGRCWHPTQVAADWRPYSLGHWEYTDVGWYWESDEPFGWACFHYGSWVDDPQIGWVWLPGTEWSPAWVVWRESDNYIGWAPCGPNLTVASPSLFMFVGIGHFTDPIRPNTVIVNNTTIIRNTRVVNNFRSETHSFGGAEHRMRVNAGPDVARVQRVSGRHFNPTPVGTVVEQSRSRANVRGEQPERQRATPAPERANERPDAREPSGAERENAPAVKPHEAPAPSVRQGAPAPQKPAIKEPSGATRESAPAPSVHQAFPTPLTPQEEHRTAAPAQAQKVERAPAAAPQQAPAPAAHSESHAAPQAQHAAPVQQDRGNEHERGHDQQ